MNRKKDIAIVFDCGATNVRVVAMHTSGVILAKHSMPNEIDKDPYLPGGQIWKIESLWAKLCIASKIVVSKIDASRIAGVTVTTFGVDGTLVDAKGNPLYPVISWQCKRTHPVAENIENYIPLKKLYEISGVFPYAFNTINKLIWFKENKTKLLVKANRFLFISSLFIHKLTGTLKNDITMLGTSMTADLKHRKVSKKILSTVGLDPELFGEIVETGTMAGEINKKAMQETGIPKGTHVFFTGHDTQFAILGSGASLNQPVLSSGTWEILMARIESFNATERELENNITTEADSVAGIFNIGQNWLASGILEWFSSNFYSELQGEELFTTMIKEAEFVEPMSHGLTINPAFYTENANQNSGSIKGLTIQTSRSQIYRALLESLAFRLREGLESLQAAGNFKAESLICVGGGSRNELWNQIRADVCKLPVHTIKQKETTVLGAAIIVFVGAKIFNSIDEARDQVDYSPSIVFPANDSQKYETAYQNYLQFKKQG
ncbi:MAG: L-fuculokinase [Prolixibacteraceae bacterium]